MSEVLETSVDDQLLADEAEFQQHVAEVVETHGDKAVMYLLREIAVADTMPIADQIQQVERLNSIFSFADVRHVKREIVFRDRLRQRRRAESQGPLTTSIARRCILMTPHSPIDIPYLKPHANDY
jgi:hypothetical protein